MLRQELLGFGCSGVPQGMITIQGNYHCKVYIYILKRFSLFFFKKKSSKSNDVCWGWMTASGGEVKYKVKQADVSQGLSFSLEVWTKWDPSFIFSPPILIIIVVQATGFCQSARLHSSTKISLVQVVISKTWKGFYKRENLLCSTRQPSWSSTRSVHLLSLMLN